MREQLCGDRVAMAQGPASERARSLRAGPRLAQGRPQAGGICHAHSPPSDFQMGSPAVCLAESCWVPVSQSHPPAPALIACPPHHPYLLASRKLEDRKYISFTSLLCTCAHTHTPSIDTDPDLLQGAPCQLGGKSPLVSLSRKGRRGIQDIAAGARLRLWGRPTPPLPLRCSHRDPRCRGGHTYQRAHG